eukprot:evm.model.NODE_3239_length_31224_cov_31.538591.2
MLVPAESREVLRGLIKDVYAQYEHAMEELMEVHIEGKKAMLKLLPTMRAQELFIIINYPPPPEVRQLAAKHLQEKRRIVLRLHEAVARRLLPQQPPQPGSSSSSGGGSSKTVMQHASTGGVDPELLARRTRALLERYMHLGQDPMGFFAGEAWAPAEKKEEKCFGLRVRLLAGTQPKANRTDILQEAQEHETELRGTVTEWESRLQGLFEATSAAFATELAVDRFPQSLHMAEALRQRQLDFTAEWESHREGYKFQVTLSQKRLEEVNAANHEEKMRLRLRSEAAAAAAGGNSSGGVRKQLQVKESMHGSASAAMDQLLLLDGGLDGASKAGPTTAEGKAVAEMNKLLQAAQLQQLEQCLRFRVLAQ